MREGRRIPIIEIKYILMGTGSNFGDMSSMAMGRPCSHFCRCGLRRILLNNLLYDLSEALIPLDNVDTQMLKHSSHWDLTNIKRFMFHLRPISSIPDFITFYVLLQLSRAQK